MKGVHLAKKLIIIESPNKIPTFKKVLGDDYVILATRGHCIDLADKKLSVDIKKEFTPTFEIKSDKKETLDNIKKTAKQSESVIIMTDLDREGEAIAWHIKEYLKGHAKSIHRAVTNEITKAGINEALNNLTDIDENKINAYLARRILDRLAGYKTSFLTKMATGGTSAGRVQSAMLRILVDREKEILSFVPKEYWVLEVTFQTDKKETYNGTLVESIEVPNQAKADEIYNAVVNKTGSITKAQSKKINLQPAAPFTTLPMVAAASSFLGWTAQKTMKISQTLYEQGLITYPRSDSPFISADATNMIRAFILTKYGKEYLPENPRQFAAKSGAQEAHECCRVTDVNNSPHLESDESKLYDLIHKRTVACQMSVGIDEKTSVITRVGEYDFATNGSVVIFDGFRKCWNYNKSEDVILPQLAIGQNCNVVKVDKTQKFTTPPPRYSDASLSKKCENEMIGRPATFARFIETLENRTYITRHKKSFQPTDLGIRVVDFLIKSEMCFVDIKFTQLMETSLDDIQDNKKTKLAVLNEFWTQLQHGIAKSNEIKQDNQKTEFVCPKCKGSLLKKYSKFGEFFSCENYNNKDGKCSYIAKIGADGQPEEKVVKAKEYATFNCKQCNSKMVKRTGKFGDFYGCENFSKGCKATADINGVFKEPKKFKKWGKKKFKKTEDE